ncbi:MAG TPA: beta-glucosidase, partial [Arthrobacter bacterium]|nr:beta-glucosidase [Arthrobacter sp.]
MHISAKDLAALIPVDFTLGVATAAFQIEGALDEDGRGPAGWDVFSAKEGAIVDGHSPAVACDHYHRMPGDVALMKQLGVDSYRFSLSWPRIQPHGSGPVNPAGLAFYDRLLDELLANGISPMVTLYHWDTPLALDDAGGWLNRDTAYRLGEFAAIAAAAYGDRVARWVTINEPATVSTNGYTMGLHSPGEALRLNALPSVHHQLLGHGLAVQALRAAGVPGGIGMSNVYSP